MSKTYTRTPRTIHLTIPAGAHDACCLKAKARAAMFEDQRAGLRERAQAINDALAKVGAP